MRSLRVAAVDARAVRTLTRRVAVTTLCDSPPGSHPRRSSWPSSATWSPSRSRRTETPYRKVASDLVSVARFDGPGGPEGRARGPHPRRAGGLPRRVVPLPARPPRAARAPSSTTPRHPRTTAAWRSPSCATPRSRPASCCRCARTRARPRSSPRRASASGRAGGDDGAPLARRLRDLREGEPPLLADRSPHDVRRGQLGDEPARADRRLRDGRDGVPLPDDRQGRRARRTRPTSSRRRRRS